MGVAYRGEKTLKRMETNTRTSILARSYRKTLIMDTINKLHLPPLVPNSVLHESSV